MAYEVTAPFWQFVDHWQTLITGFLAVLAALVTVWATINSANREIATAQEQTKAAQRQTAVTRGSIVGARVGTISITIKA